MGWSQQESNMTAKQNTFHKNFYKKAKKEHLDLIGFKEILPCSLEAVDHCGELYIEGKNKLIEEIRHASNIPSSRRKIIDSNYI